MTECKVVLERVAMEEGRIEVYVVVVDNTTAPEGKVMSSTGLARDRGSDSGLPAWRPGLSADSPELGRVVPGGVPLFSSFVEEFVLTSQQKHGTIRWRRWISTLMRRGTSLRASLLWAGTG
jgi:hypothetical protein